MSTNGDERNESESETMFVGSLDDHQKFKLPSNASLNSILSWSIEHSDPELLKQKLKERKTKTELTEEDLKWMEVLFPDVKKQSNELLDVLTDSTAASEDIASAMDIVQYMSEEIDYANAMEGLGVLSAVVDIACDSDKDIECRSIACWTIGSACVNNAKVRKDVEGYPQVIPTLLDNVRNYAGKVNDVKSSDPVYLLVTRSVTALSALLKSQSGLVQFAEGDGFAIFVDALSKVNDAMVRMKILFNFSKIITNASDKSIVFTLFREKLGLIAVLEQIASELNDMYTDKDKWNMRYNDELRKLVRLIGQMSADEESKQQLGSSESIVEFLTAVKEMTAQEKEDEDDVHNMDREEIFGNVVEVLGVIGK